jgi:ADP-heptose:LPS heptosyltransferase
LGRIVVLHPGALGDVLLAVPALRALRAGAPADELVLAAQPRIGALLTSLAVVDRDIAFDTLGLETLFTDDDPPERLRTLVADARVVSWFGAGDATFVRRLRALVPDAVISSTKPPPATTVWRHLLASTHPLAGGPEGAIEDACRPMPVPSALAAKGRRALTAAGWAGERGLLMIHPGAGGVTKRWPTEGFAAVAETLVKTAGLDVVVHDGPADHAAVAALRARLTVPAFTLTDVPLPALAGALTHVALWIGNDSGVSHLAAAVGAPTLVLFAEANLAWRPWAEHARTPVVNVGPLLRPAIDGVVAEAASVLRSEPDSIRGAASLR